MKAKKEIYAGNQFTFFESPQANLENQTTAKRSTKKGSVVYDTRFDFPVLIPPYSTVDKGDMESNLLSCDNIQPGDTIETRQRSRALYVRDLEKEMAIVDSYMSCGI